tara:strand:+ start:540 stop:707 length:168 start_codon:yes stop_codon:yes gene_type:complete
VEASNNIAWWSKEKVMKAISGQDEQLFARLILMEQYQEREYGRSTQQVLDIINSK